jgi:NAD(P)-dependent dehydrogenase (short-subunit alcohol dehydrogenase family)
MRISGRVAVVTGASSGLGRAAALALARQGAHVGLVARREEALAEVAREVGRLGARAHAVACDVADPVAVDRALERVRAELGEPDILVNAAGTGIWKPFLEITGQEHRAMMEVNYWGTFHWIRAVLPGMRARRRGRIVNVASGAGKFALPVTSGYSASKFAVSGLSEALHRELIGSGVGVSCLCPGSIRTPFWKEENTPARLIPPLVRYAPKLSPGAAARSVLYCIWLGFPVWTTPVFVNVLAKLNGLWLRLGDLILWKWFLPVVAAVVVARLLPRVLGLQFG